MFFIGSHDSENHRKEKKNKVKEELLNSLRENDREEMEINITSINDQREAINVINHYEEITKKQNKKIRGYTAIQGEMLKKFKDTEDFTENVALSRSTVYFKIGLYKFFKKVPVLKNST